MTSTSTERSEATKALLAQVEFRAGDTNVIVGPPHVLKALCAVLGFKNDCRDGRVYVTTAKLRWLGVR